MRRISKLTHTLPSAEMDASGLDVTISGWGGTRQYDPEDCSNEDCDNIVQPRQCTLKEATVKVRLYLRNRVPAIGLFNIYNAGAGR